ncbi:MAG: response regulator [Bacteroidales bacterium]|nr:response regulator [Bacteroidales bacterium]MBK8884155.1 response regulator [Bacteroidales bacterium]
MDYNSAIKPKILVVDDNLKNVQVLGGFLQNEGFEVEFALEGKSALDWIRKQKFDLVLLDIMMPEMDGYEVCGIIKKKPENKELPIIFITAKSDHESIIQAFEAGGVDYITKPFIKSELLARVRIHIEIKRSHDRLERAMREIAEKNRSITASIEYARNIQTALLRTSETFIERLPENFILYLPKDIVSGDFYWFTCINDLIVVAVMDCTGHGVPGALMSTLGVTSLNETVLGERITRPDLIIDSLRTKIIDALGQKGYSGYIKDAIEGSVITYDHSTRIIEFSASFNPLLIIHNDELKEIKADRIPIGYYERVAAFTNTTLTVSQNDIIYLFSDGFIDQFGGPSSKRFLLKRFKELLFANHKLPLNQQKELLLEALNKWKANGEQTDDILVIALRF